MARASDKVKMDSCAFNLKMHGVSEEEGTEMFLEILVESTGFAREDIRAKATKMGRGTGEYVEVRLDADVGSVVWWRSEVSRGTKKGTVMVEGEHWFFVKVMEKIMWRAREWGRFRRVQGIAVTDDRLKKPKQRKKMWVVVVSDEEGRREER